VRQPRRIFRSSALRFRLPPALVFWALAVAGTAALVLTGVTTELFGRAPPGPDQIAADASEVAVVGGDTLRLDGMVVRLRGVAAPMRGDACAGSADCGAMAVSAMANLIRDRRVACRLDGHDGAGRPVAECSANGTDLSRAIVASGWARAQSGAPELADLELRARRQRAGLWADASAR